jgi:hypothetical protein
MKRFRQWLGRRLNHLGNTVYGPCECQPLTKVKDGFESVNIGVHVVGVNDVLAVAIDFGPLTIVLPPEESMRLSSRISDISRLAMESIPNGEG